MGVADEMMRIDWVTESQHELNTVEMPKITRKTKILLYISILHGASLCLALAVIGPNASCRIVGVIG